jgi:hypothetical protein
MKDDRPWRKWTPLDNERLRSLAISGMESWEIAAELKRTVVAVRAKAEQCGISLKRVTVAPRPAWSSSEIKVKK